MKSAECAIATSAYALTSTSLFTPNTRPSITISTGPSQEAFVVIRPDGTIEYGKDYTPDAAAKAFWDALGLEREERC
jgi:hypothetical protein